MAQTRNLLFLFLLLTPFTLNSCLATKLAEALSQHQLRISQAANSDAKPSEKFDIVAETFVSVLDEALRYGQAKKAVKHVELFSQQNDKDLDKILKEFGDWTGELSTAEKLLFAGRTATKPYTRQLIDLIPKFERKVERRIRTFLFLHKVAKAVAPGKLLGGS